MLRQPAPSRAMANRLLLTLLAALLTACESETPPGAPRRTEESPVTGGDGSTSDEPTSDVEVRTFRLDSRSDLLEHLRVVDWVELVVLPGADPFHLELWSGDGHWHATTTYRLSGVRVFVTQADFEGLPPGRLVLVRGDYGVRSEGGLYWLERGFTLALRPGERSLADKLEWIPLR